MVVLTDTLAKIHNTTFLHTSCSSEQMKFSGADKLSRVRCRRVFGIPVQLVTRRRFDEFKAFLFSGTRDLYLEMLAPLLSHRVSPEFLFYMASYAAFAKQDKTNNKRIRDSLDAKSKALALNITDLLPAAQISGEDAGYAALATAFAIDN